MTGVSPNRFFLFLLFSPLCLVLSHSFYIYFFFLRSVFFREEEAHLSPPLLSTATTIHMVLHVCMHRKFVVFYYMACLDCKLWKWVFLTQILGSGKKNCNQFVKLSYFNTEDLKYKKKYTEDFRVLHSRRILVALKSILIWSEKSIVGPSIFPCGQWIHLRQGHFQISGESPTTKYGRHRANNSISVVHSSSSY